MSKNTQCRNQSTCINPQYVEVKSYASLFELVNPRAQNRENPNSGVLFHFLINLLDLARKINSGLIWRYNVTVGLNDEALWVRQG